MLRVGVFSTQRLHCITSWTEAITLMVIFGAVRSGRDAWDRHLNDTMNQGSRDIMIQTIWSCKMLQKCDGYNGSGNYLNLFELLHELWVIQFKGSQSLKALTPDDLKAMLCHKMLVAARDGQEDFAEINHDQTNKHANWFAKCGYL